MSRKNFIKGPASERWLPRDEVEAVYVEKRHKAIKRNTKRAAKKQKREDLLALKSYK